MAKTDALLALTLQLADHALQDPRRMRIWLALAPGARTEDLPPLAEPLRAVVGPFLTGWVDPDGLRSLVDCAAVDDLELAEPLKLERPPPRHPAGRGRAAWADDRHPAGVAAPAGQGPVLGLIDTGLPFAHRGLLQLRRGRRSTRMLAIWDQDPQPDFGARGRIPARYRQGAVLERSAMNGLIEAAAGDEAAVYRAAGYGALAPRRTHGAHVLGLLAMSAPPVDAALGLQGADSAAALQADVLGVQLPRALLHAPSRAALAGAVLDGLCWMREVCGPRPLRVAVPYGSTLGPHDGSSLFERVLDALLAESQGRLQVYLPAGNSHEMALHAVLSTQRPADGVGERAAPDSAQRPAQGLADPPARSAGSAGSAESTGSTGSTGSPAPAAEMLTWRQPPASEACSWIELWAPAGLLRRVELRPPVGRACLVLDLADGRPAAVAGPEPALGDAALAYARHPGSALGEPAQTGVLIRIPPTLVSTSGRSAGPAGDWQIGVELDPAQPGALHAYGSRARGSFGSAVRAHQGRFVVAAGSAWRVEPRGSISGLACGRQPEAGVVGAFLNGQTRARPDQPEPSPYTASGPGRNGRAVDLSLAGDHSRLLRGVRSSGTLSSISWRMDGSSVAVPQAARLGIPVPDAPADPRLGAAHIPGPAR